MAVQSQEKAQPFCQNGRSEIWNVEKWLSFSRLIFSIILLPKPLICYLLMFPTSKFVHLHFLFNELFKAIVNLIPVTADFRSLSRISNSDELCAIIREVPPNGSNGTHKQYLEVWKHHQLYQNYDLAALEVHGDVYTDGKLHFSQYTITHRYFLPLIFFLSVF